MFTGNIQMPFEAAIEIIIWDVAEHDQMLNCVTSQICGETLTPFPLSSTDSLGVAKQTKIHVHPIHKYFRSCKG